MASTTLWAVHIQGPDDIVPTADYLSAVRCANAFNAWWTNFKTEKPLDDYDPRMWASPIEWTGDAERHAEWVQNPSPDYAYFLRLSAQQREPVVRVKELKWPPRCPLGQRVHNRPALVNYTIAHYGGEIGAAIYRWAEAHSPWSEALATYEAAKSAAQADYEQRIMAAIEVQSSDVEAYRDCSEASRRNSSEPEPSTSVSNQYRKSIDRIYRSTDREIWSGEIQSSDGGAGSRRAISKQRINEPAVHEDRTTSVAAAGDMAGVALGPSEAIADVGVDELARIIERAVIDDCKTKPGSAWFDGLPAAARAVLARYRIERLDRLAGGRR